MKKLACALLLAVCGWAQERLLLERVDDQVYRGKQPKREDFVKLANSGIKTVLDLRSWPDYKTWERNVVEAAGMQYVRVPLSGFFPPTKKQMDRILALLDDPQRGPVFIHCMRGADRSGVVIACYRMTHDRWTNEQAMQEARDHGVSKLEILMRRYIRNFTPAPALGIK